MGTTTSEPCIYDKLSESIDILRQSGYRYGMSEREIERFIKRMLETNEPRHEPPQFPLLRATVKLLLAVGFLLLAALVFTYPHDDPYMGTARPGSCNWSSPFSHVRLLALPIAKKYNLQGFHEWWSLGSPRHSLVNCSGCAEISTVLEVPESLRGTVTLRRGPQLVLLKGGETLCIERRQLEELYLAHSASVSVLLEDDEEATHNLNTGLPQGPANFTLLWNAVSIAAEIEEVGGQPVSAQTIRRTLHRIGVHGCHPRRKPLLKMTHKKARKQFAEDMSTKHMDYWNHVQWSDEKGGLSCVPSSEDVSHDILGGK
ncbi:bombesin receptor-activated protein C6orf89 homolog isoform X2 [Corythoichthys intestinalis]|uniref:bombesin receptor-activated protein C6orf89 homolog isoform X2 n=1 Tax=Corythoichthys intestinalis TaxID=161448 RepID=UPI0025A4E78A|nr:bombesin receptor-activated protein C6orf89 homolog isoform X2 [Corythoichthys intestinalis]